MPDSFTNGKVGYEGKFRWEAPENQQAAAFGRASWPLFTVAGVKINYNLLLHTRAVADNFHGTINGEWELKIVSSEKTISLGQFKGFSRANKFSLQRFYRGYVELSGEEWWDFSRASRKFHIEITYTGGAGDVPHNLVVDQLTIQYWRGDSETVEYLRDIGLLPTVASLQPK